MQTIQWFPGHMAKAKREITEKLNLVDLVIELKDARIPYSSTNPMIDEIVGTKPRLILLCKSSLADAEITKRWMDYYRQKGILSLDIDSVTNYHISGVFRYAKLAVKDVLAARKKRGIASEQIKAIILGIPNVGKSTLINTLAKRKAAAVGDKPGVTKSQTWIRITDDIVLLDTPGILWPKFEDQTVGLRLAMCGSIKDEILDLEAVTAKALEYMTLHYPKLLMERYKLSDLEENPYAVMESIARKRGCLLKGGMPDIPKVCGMIMNELRASRIGAMSYEEPGED